MTTSMSIDIADRDIIKMVEEFLANRHLDISLMCLERESGIINGEYPHCFVVWGQGSRGTLMT